MPFAEAQVGLGLGDTGGALEDPNRGEGLALEMGMRPPAWHTRPGTAKVFVHCGPGSGSDEEAE